MDPEGLYSLITQHEPAAEKREKADRLAVRVPSPKLPQFMSWLHASPELAFDMLIAHTAVDWPAEDRFELVYILYSTVHGHSLMVCTDVPRSNPIAPTVSGIWPIAEWQEREVFDMFGVQYDDHPDLRRLMLEDDWVGYPLRKDYRDDYMLELPK